MTMRATRDALANPWQTVWMVDDAEPERGAQPSIVERDTSAALAEVEAMERWAEKAVARMGSGPKCPVHGIPDCSPLLNGCNLPNRILDLLAEYAEMMKETT